MTDDTQLKPTDNNILFLDISSSCTGYAIGRMDYRKKEAVILQAGVIWFGNDWDHGRKYNYLFNYVLNDAYVNGQIFEIVAEAYMVNKKRMMGTLVIPEATGAVKAACYEADPPIGFQHIYPQSWRSLLGIKKNTKYAGTKAWKEPAKEFVDNKFPGAVPAQITSNITKKPRPTPYDIYDVICIACAYFKKYEIDKVDFKAVLK